MTDPVKTCANCGHAQSSGAFCEACGTKLPEGASGVAGAAAPGRADAAPAMGHAPPARYDKAFWGRFFDLSFEQFITPSIIKVLFVLAMVFIGLGTLTWIVLGFVEFGAWGVFTLIAALIGGFIYLLMARVLLEMVVVFFRIRDDTEELTRLKR